MLDDYVQVNIRMTSSQRDKLRSIAKEKDTSMNKFILDQTLNNRTDDRMNEENDRTLIKVLKERLNKQDGQLEKKDDQINKLQNVLDQQQRLTLQTNQQIERLQLEESKNKETEPKNERGFFARLFNL